MPLPQYSDVGLSSNPDPRPANDATTLVTPANFSDPQANDITMSVSGRLVRVYARNPNPYSPQAHN